jgi:hypothetical protein
MSIGRDYSDDCFLSFAYRREKSEIDDLLRSLAAELNSETMLALPVIKDLRHLSEMLVNVS